MRYLILLILLVSSSVNADVPAGQVKEVTHLLDYIKNSGCTINRNGSDYPAYEALEHINSKYNYYRDEIKSTEDFIMLAASKSVMSGDYYMVTCPGNEVIKTQDWLLTELGAIRSEKQ